MEDLCVTSEKYITVLQLRSSMAVPVACEVCT